MDNFKFKLKNEFIKGRVYNAVYIEDIMINKGSLSITQYYEVTWNDEIGNGKVTYLAEAVVKHLQNEAWIKVE